MNLVDAKRPAILVGGGAYKARDAIMAFAEDWRIPVFRTWNALDVATDDHPCYAGTVGTYGGPGRNFGIQNADYLIVLGCRISGRITGGQPETFARAAHRVWVDADMDLLAQHEWVAHQTVCEDVGAWIAKQPAATRTFKDWRAQCRQWRERYDPVTDDMLATWHHYGFMRVLSTVIPEDAVITYDTGGNAIMMGHCFRSKRGQRIISSNGSTPMGGALCYAIGAAFAQPSRPIVCIIGDGGMQLNIQELQTIRHYGLPIKVFVINNGVLGNTKSFQRVNNKPELCCGPDGYSAPDFCAVAQAYRLRAARIDSWLQCEAVLKGVFGDRESAVIDVQDYDRCKYEPRVSRWDTPIEDMQPFLPRPEFRANMLIEPMKGWENNK